MAKSGGMDPMPSQFEEQLHPKLPSFLPPKTVIFCSSSSWVRDTLKEMPHQSCTGSFSKLLLLNKETAIADFGTRASVIAKKMEELVLWGVEQFIWIGEAESLQSKAKFADVVICEKAIRDETVSNTYLPTAKYIHAPRRMTNKLQHHLKKIQVPFLIGSTWTTDRLYRQLSEEATQYQKEGVLTVETTAAALFAFAHFYRVDLGAMFIISEAYSEVKPTEGLPLPKGQLRTLLDVALNASQDT